jgi:DeoR family fructose operon transcriptional repressor
MKSARRSIVVADHSKFGRAEFGRIAPLDRSDEIITDGQVTAAQVAELSARGLDVRIAGTSE